MSWDAIGAIGEIIGAAAVVLSLGYLAVQIRNQNAESRAAAMHDISVGWRAASEQFTDGELADIFIKANRDFESLSEADALRFVAGVHSIFRVFEEAYNQHVLGRLDQKIWDAMNRQYAAYLAAPAFRKYSDMRGYQYNEDFQGYVGQIQPTDWDVK
jgi:hypothetical protein